MSGNNRNKITLQDFLDQMQMIRRMGSLKDFLKTIPGLGHLFASESRDADNDLRRIESVIYAMTPQERRNPDLIDASRCRRIAIGAGTDLSSVDRLLKDFLQMASMAEKLSGMGMTQKMQTLREAYSDRTLPQSERLSGPYGPWRIYKMPDGRWRRF